MLPENAITSPTPPDITGASLTPVNPTDRAGWDALVTARQNYSFFHGAAWAETLQHAYGFRPVYFTADEPGGRTGLLPVMEVDSWLTGKRGIALPFTDNCGPLYSDIACGRKLIQSALAYGRSCGWKYIEFRGGRELFGDAPASLSFHGHCVNLAADEDRLFARLESSVRRAIRKSGQNGVVVTVSPDLAAMKIFYSLHCLTRRKHGLPPPPFSFFRAIQEKILARGLGLVVVARLGKQPVAASVYFRLGTRAIYKYGASDESFQQLRGSNLVMWEAIKCLARQGATTLHLGKTALANEGLRRYKLGWGAEEEKIEYVKYDLRRNRFVTETDHVTGWHNRLFRALPAGASRMIGAVLYRHSA